MKYSIFFGKLRLGLRIDVYNRCRSIVTGAQLHNMLLFLPLKLFDFDNIKFHISYPAPSTQTV